LYSVFNFTETPHPTPDDLFGNQTYVSEQLKLYWTKREGAYTITHFGGNVVTFLPLPNITSDYESIVHLAESSIPKSLQGSSTSYLEGYKTQRAIIARMYGSYNASVQETGFGGGATMPITLVKPLSRGTINIISSNILDEPAFDFGVFTHPADIEIVVAALKINRELMKTSPMQELGPVEIAPGANITTDEEIKRALRASMVPTYSHPCCTCPMMPEALGGVVDSDLLVYGVEGLSVVDASIMPMIPATHLSATVYAIAEKVGILTFVLWVNAGLIRVVSRLRISLKQGTACLTNTTFTDDFNLYRVNLMSTRASLS
jgi:choline dehydrogenase-like flavoprotein